MKIKKFIIKIQRKLTYSKKVNYFQYENVTFIRDEKIIVENVTYNQRIKLIVI